MSKKSGDSAAITPRFSKRQLLSSERFRDKRDALTACLDDDKNYSVGEAEKALADFLKGKV